jgi:thymidylate synthase (FAD)
MNTTLLNYTKLNEIQKYAPYTSTKILLPHLAYTFAIEKISRACSHQLVRHRNASFSQQSQRYITVKRLKEKVIIPPSIEDSDKQLFLNLIDNASDSYQRLVKTGLPKEDARFILPNATETSLLMTMDGAALMHFFGLRCCNRAQWEIRTLADIMLNLLRDVEPNVFNNAGPYCYQLGYCPEGRFTCGKQKEAVEKYKVKNDENPIR